MEYHLDYPIISADEVGNPHLPYPVQIRRAPHTCQDVEEGVGGNVSMEKLSPLYMWGEESPVYRWPYISKARQIWHVAKCLLNTDGSTDFFL